MVEAFEVTIYARTDGGVQHTQTHSPKGTDNDSGRRDPGARELPLDSDGSLGHHIVRREETRASQACEALSE
jgi:hypothetical protein